MVQIPFAKEGTQGSFFPVYRNHPLCYLCDNPSSNYAQYLVGTHDLVRDLKLFKNLFDNNKLHYQVRDAEDAMIELGACDKHLENLRSLEKSIHDNGKTLSEDLIKKNIL
jgi:hypothetical protein